MNKQMIFKIAGIAALIAADTAISIFSVKGYYKRYYEKISRDEISQMSAYHQERLEKAKKLVAMAERQAADIELYKTRVKTDKKNYAKKVVESGYSVDPAESEHPEDDIPSPEVALELDGIRMTREDAEKRGYDCEEIHISMFGEDPTYTTETLTYYIYDDILVDDQDLVIDRPEDLVGGVLLESGFTQNGDENIYIRNHRLRSDYEIIKVFASFQEHY